MKIKLSKMIRWSVQLFGVLIVAGCVTNSLSSPEHLEAAINKARIALPDTSGAEWSCSGYYQMFKEFECADQITQKMPVVIHAHGCTGFNHSDETAMELYQRLGWAVIAPNSFALNRSSTCGTGNMARTSEIDRALHLALSQSWVDKSKIIVSGFSEGGLNAAVYTSPQIIAKIVMGYGCHRGGNLSTKTLNVVGISDTQVGNSVCTGAAELYRSDSGHHIFVDPKSSEVIEAFIRSL